MSAIIVDGDIVHYEVLGRGRPAVLVHGWVGSWRYWIPTMQQLHLKYRVYAIDLFGFGDSAKNPQKYTLDYQLTLLKEFMTQLGLGKAALIGHGLGAYIVTAFAGKHPELVPRLLIASAPLFDTGDLATRGKQVPLNVPKSANDKRVNDKPAMMDDDFTRPVTPMPNPSSTSTSSPPLTDLTVARRPDLSSLDNGEATIRNAKAIDRARIQAAAEAQKSQDGSSLSGASDNRRPLQPPFPPTSSFPNAPIESKDATPLLRPTEFEAELSAAGLTSSEVADAANVPTDNPLYGKVGRFDSVTLLQRCFKRTEPEYGKLSQDVIKQDDRAFQSLSKDFDPGKMLDTLRGLPMPVVIVHGIEDPVIEVPNENIWTYLTTNKEDTLLPIPLPGVRHFPMLEATTFPRLVTDFLDTADISKLEIKEIWRRRAR
jgi:pimeloyl-ACP methyl ester carboxylesterase